MLRELPTQMAGLVLQAVLAYEEGEVFSQLPERAAEAYAIWVKLINLSKARARAGKVGSEKKHENFVCHQQKTFATNKTPEKREQQPGPEQASDDDVMAMLAGFM